MNTDPQALGALLEESQDLQADADTPSGTRWTSSSSAPTRSARADGEPDLLANRRFAAEHRRRGGRQPGRHHRAGRRRRRRPAGGPGLERRRQLVPRRPDAPDGGVDRGAGGQHLRHRPHPPLHRRQPGQPGGDQVRPGHQDTAPAAPGGLQRRRPAPWRQAADQARPGVRAGGRQGGGRPLRGHPAQGAQGVVALALELENIAAETYVSDTFRQARLRQNRALFASIMGVEDSTWPCCWPSRRCSRPAPPSSSPCRPQPPASCRPPPATWPSPDAFYQTNNAAPADQGAVK